MSPQNRSLFRPLTYVVTLLGLIPAILPGSALADWKDSQITNLVTKKIFVESNGVSYHRVSGLANIVADVRFQVNTGAAGRVQSWEGWLDLASDDGHWISLREYGKRVAYKWNARPRHVDRTERLIVPSTFWRDFVLDRCNDLAAKLRGQDLGNAAIFALNRSLYLTLRPTIVANTTGAGADNFLEEGAATPTKTVELICKKWSGPSIPQASDDLGVYGGEVVNKGLSIYELYGMSGVCKIRLDGWITTDVKNVDVTFRYKNQEGKLSQVWTVNTGNNKTATFSHWYNVDNNYDPETGIDWAESGFVRIIGVSHDFKTDWAEYTMECVEGGPDHLTVNGPPKLKMVFVEQGKIMVHGYICPESLKLVGVLEGRGGFSGYAGFVGQGYISPPVEYSITQGQKIPLGADYPLDWDSVAAPQGNDGPRLQVRVDFNATNENNVIISSLKNRFYMAICRKPVVSPGIQVQGDMTIEPQVPAASRQMPGALKALPAQPEAAKRRQRPALMNRRQPRRLGN